MIRTREQPIPEQPSPASEHTPTPVLTPIIEPNTLPTRDPSFATTKPTTQVAPASTATSKTTFRLRTIPDTNRGAPSPMMVVGKSTTDRMVQGCEFGDMVAERYKGLVTAVLKAHVSQAVTSTPSRKMRNARLSEQEEVVNHADNNRFARQTKLDRRTICAQSKYEMRKTNLSPVCISSR